MEVRRTGQSGQSNDFLLQGDFTGLSPDLDQTSSRIWSSPMDCPLGPLELAGSSVRLGFCLERSSIQVAGQLCIILTEIQQVLEDHYCGP